MPKSTRMTQLGHGGLSNQQPTCFDDHTQASRLLILPTRGNPSPTIQQLKACPGLVFGGFEGGERLKQIGLFEMRRLEMLSNTIFGVAMTLLAYDLPKASSFKSAPNWIDLLNVYAQPVIALMISFIVAGLF